MRKLLWPFVMAVMFFLTACGSDKTSGNQSILPTDYKYTAQIDVMNIVYQPQGVSYQNNGVLYYSEWEDDGMEIICEDPACEHKDKTCSARVGSGSLSLLHENRRFIIQGKESEYEIIDDMERIIYQKSELIEADTDGSNRKNVDLLDIGMPFFSGIVYEDTLYIAGIQSQYEKRTDNGLIYNELVGGYIQNFSSEDYSNCVILSVDLNTYEVTEVLKTERSENSPQFYFYADEEAVYVYENEWISHGEDSEDFDFNIALYTINGVTATKLLEKKLFNTVCSICGVNDGQLYFRYVPYDDTPLGELDGIFCINDGKVLKLENKTKFGGIMDGKTFVAIDEGERYKIKYEFYECDSDKLLYTIEYPESVGYVGGDYWGKRVYIKYKDSDAGLYYYTDLKDIKEIGKKDKLLFDISMNGSPR